MDKQIIEITKDGFSISLHAGFLIVEKKEENIKKQIALDSILSLILSANDIVISKNIINALTEQGACIIFCGKNYLPMSIVLSYTGHWLSAPRTREQVAASKPLQKTLWKSIIQEKIKNQVFVLKCFYPQSPAIERLKRLSKDTLSGDTTNNEGIASAIYFKALFGRHFIRDRFNEDVNILLNYTYTVLRAMVARAVAGNGLLPYLGLKHCSKSNSLPLVDDLIEPFRAIADKIVIRLLSDLNIVDKVELTPEIKRALTQVIIYPVQTEKGQVTLNEAIYDFVTSLVKSFEVKKVMLKYPKLD